MESCCTGFYFNCVNCDAELKWNLLDENLRVKLLAYAQLIHTNKFCLDDTKHRKLMKICLDNHLDVGYVPNRVRKDHNISLLSFQEVNQW